MRNLTTSNVHFRTGEKPGIWFALLIAFCLHLIFLFLPAKKSIPDAENQRTNVELQLVKFTPPPEQQPLPDQPAEIIPAPTEPAVEQPFPEPPESMATAQSEPEPPIPTPGPAPNDQTNDLENLSKAEKDRLTHSILARQFISEESATDKIFGKQVILQIDDPQKEFHIPVRQDMISMLDQPMPEVPFAYTPGLVRFAYDPGVKGNLQRFWDVITPEFGWRTKNGTKVECVWLLVIAACGWQSLPTAVSARHLPANHSQ